MTGRAHIEDAADLRQYASGEARRLKSGRPNDVGEPDAALAYRIDLWRRGGGQ